MRVMFFYPNRDQAKKVQVALEALYGTVSGLYFHGDAAWKYVHEHSGVDLKAIFERIAKERDT